jgi:hypothetical protein
VGLEQAERRGVERLALRGGEPGQATQQLLDPLGQPRPASGIAVDVDDVIERLLLEGLLDFRRVDAEAP